MKKIIIALVIVLFVAGIGYGAYRQGWIRLPIYPFAIQSPKPSEPPPSGMCAAGTRVMSLDEAKRIASSSACGSDFGSLALCNGSTGTWWIDLRMQKQGCSPACVVDVASGKAEINWRCTGLLQPSPSPAAFSEKDVLGYWFQNGAGQGDKNCPVDGTELMFGVDTHGVRTFTSWIHCRLSESGTWSAAKGLMTIKTATTTQQTVSTPNIEMLQLGTLGVFQRMHSTEMNAELQSMRARWDAMIKK